MRLEASIADDSRVLNLEVKLSDKVWVPRILLLTRLPEKAAWVSARNDRVFRIVIGRKYCCVAGRNVVTTECSCSSRRADRSV